MSTHHFGRRRVLALATAVAVVATLAVGCGKDDSGTKENSATSTTEATGGEGAVLRVPEDHETIQAAVDAAKPGDMVLVGKGVYEEAVDVETDDVTIRGVDRNEVILDGGFELENGIRVLDTDGVVVENMTARNYVSNGFFWTGSDRYRGSYLTAYRNGDYGIYAFDSYHGQFDSSYGSGSPDAGFYIGQCFECDAVLDNVVSEYNGLGYSGTNSGGELYIVNSTFRNNRAGIVPNSGSYELCYPGRSNVIVGNIIHDNNYMDGPGIDVSLLAQGNGILLAGSINNTVERNLVFNHDKAGIAAFPFPEEDASDEPPAVDELDIPCVETLDDEIPTEPVGLVMWNATGNRIVGNVIEASGQADLASGTLSIEDGDLTTAELNNCFSGNTFTTSAPTDLEKLAPCDGTGSGGDFEAGAFDLMGLIASQPAKPPKDSYKTTPEPGLQPSMPDAETAPHPRFEGPEKPDVASIEVPAKPA
ncbi:MAG: right-handed parallel beta-helix repeat-containing protein [Acidimicrobiales bacterium]